MTTDTTSVTQNAPSNTGLVRFRQRETAWQLETKIVNEFIEYAKTMPTTPDPISVQRMLLPEIRQAIDNRNGSADKTDIWSKPQFLAPQHVGELMLSLNHVVMLSMNSGTPSRDNAMLAIYCSDGEKAGCYSLDINLINACMDAYAPFNASRRNDCVTYLKAHAPLLKRNFNKELIAVKNGIFNHATKTIEPFTPDVVFTSKIPVNYNPAATNVHITMPDGEIWDCDSQIASFSPDNQQQIDFHWQLLSAVCRPLVPFNRAILMYSEIGNNGKGTFCRLISNLVGQDNTKKVALDEFQKDFLLAPVMNGATCIIADENNVGEYIDGSSNFKSMITHDPVKINGKYKDPIDFVFYGNIIECMNSLPRVRDTSNSFTRRIVFDPFNECFEGTERKYIKEDYLQRQDVLEYYLMRALSQDCEEYTIPDISLETTMIYRAYNDSIMDFWEETKDVYVWSVLSQKFLYSMFKGWSAKNNPSSKPCSSIKFFKQLAVIISNDPDSEWVVKDGKNDGHLFINSELEKDLAQYEPMIIEYDVRDFMDKHYNGAELQRIANPPIPSKIYNRIERKDLNS